MHATVLLFAALILTPAAARAAEVAVTGNLGFMGEWQVVGKTRGTAAGRPKEFTGTLTLTHIGLCTVNGPVEKSGEIRFRRTGLVWSGIEATLVFDGKQCAFAARGTKTYEGTLQCPGGGGIPLRLQLN